MNAIASAQQPSSFLLAAAGSPSFLPASRSFHTVTDPEAEFDNGDDNESSCCSTNLPFATPPSQPVTSSSSSLAGKKIIRRRSSRSSKQQQQRTTLQKNAGGAVKRTVSQKRKRAEAHHVTFRDDNLVECVTIETYCHDLEDEDGESCPIKKNEIWYDPDELRQQTYNELSRNWQFHRTKGPVYPLEESNLSWRGLEDYGPSSPTNSFYYHQDGAEKRLEKIRIHVSIILAIARSHHGGTVQSQQQQRTAELEDEEEGDWENQHEEELAERSYLLSKSDRDDAIERAQKDAYEALREHGVEYGPGYEYGANRGDDYYYDDYYDEESALTTGCRDMIANKPTSVIETLVTWFCL